MDVDPIIAAFEQRLDAMDLAEYGTPVHDADEPLPF